MNDLGRSEAAEHVRISKVEVPGVIMFSTWMLTFLVLIFVLKRIRRWSEFLYTKRFTPGFVFKPCPTSWLGCYARVNEAR